MKLNHLNYTNDEMKILEAVSRTSLPIIIKGKAATGKSSLTEYLKEFNNERKHIIDEVSAYNNYTDEQKKDIKNKKVNQLVIAGHTIPAWMESELGDHIQITAIRLNKDKYTFKVGFVKIPEVKKKQITLSNNKHRALAIIDNKPSKEQIYTNLFKNGDDVEFDLQLPVHGLFDLQHIVEILRQQEKMNAILEQQFHTNPNERPILIYVYMHMLKKEMMLNNNERMIALLLKELNELCKTGDYYMVAIETQGLGMSKEYGLQYEITHSFVEEEEEEKVMSVLLNFDLALDLVTKTKKDVIISNQTGKPSTQLTDYIDMYSFPRDQHVTVRNIDNYYFRADLLHELNKEYEKIVLMTNKPETAYEEMLDEPIKIKVISAGGREHYYVSNVEFKLASKPSATFDNEKGLKLKNADISNTRDNDRSELEEDRD